MTPDFQWYWQAFLYRIPEVLPWLLGGLAGLAAVSLSPLGRALIRHLRSRRAETDLLEDLVTHVGAMRQELGEALERLDAAERRLRQLPGRAPIDTQSAEGPQPSTTPH